MVSKNQRKDQPDWLPPGWRLQIKVKNSRKFKVYVHSKTSQKLYSRLAVLRHIKNGSIDDDSNTAKEHAEKSSKKEVVQIVAENDLPAGWTVEKKFRQSGVHKGTAYWCYIDPSTGNKFYSKPEVFRYLHSIQNRAGSSRQEEGRSTRHSSKNVCCSRLAVRHHIKNGSVDNDSNATKEHAEKSSKKKDVQIVAENYFMKDLPAGWRVEEKIRQIGVQEGTAYRCYIDPSTGNKFYSKPEVFRYLRSIQNHAWSSKQEEGRHTRHSSKNRSGDRLKAQESKIERNASQGSKTPSSGRLSSGKNEVVVENTADCKTPSSRRLSSRDKVVIENTVDKDLPPGWIKEMRTRIKGRKVRIDPFYFHPASGLVFRSKVKVLRYLEIGEISRHTYRRRSNVGTEDSAIEKTSPKSLVKREITTNCTARRITRSSSSFLAGEESPKESPLSTPKAELPKENSVRRITRSSSSLFPSEEFSNGTPSSLPDVTVAKQDTVRRITRSSKGSPPVTSEAKVAKEETPKRITRSLPRVQPTSISEDSPDQIIWSEGTPPKKTKDKKMPPSTSSPNKSTVKSTVTISVTGCSNKKTHTPKRKTIDQKTTTTPSRSSKRVAGIDVHPVFFSIPIEHTRRKNSIGDRPVPNLVEKKSPDNDTQNGTNDSVSQPARHNTLEATTIATLSTQEEQGKTQSLPFFSEAEVINLPPTNTELSSENLTLDSILEPQPDSLIGNKTENSLPSGLILGDHSIPESRRDPLFENKLEGPPDINVTWTEPSGSEFRFPPPVWSDPCLEFAYKTLTGAIPLDDTLAIEDYIQHQLRTSKQNDEFQTLPDIDMPSGLTPQKTTQVPPLPETSMKLPNGNGLTPQQTQHVKN